MRGNEELALATARMLAAAQPKIEAEAAKRGFPRQQYYDTPRQGKDRPYLDFLEQLPQLRADLERREREGERASTGLTNLAGQSARIAALIRDLDLVQARQWSQPGGVNTGEDPVVGALIQEGDAAVEPLLDCLETDKRLTRCVAFHRDFFRSRTVIPVSGAASTALKAILRAHFNSAAEIRAYWKHYGAMELEERWYVILKDDAAGMDRWREAAGNITQPDNIRAFPGTGFRIVSSGPSNAPVKLLGDVLRAKSKPSVSELLARRAVEMPTTNLGSYDLGDACEIGLRLAVWDAPAALPVARTLVERCRAVLEYSQPERSRDQSRVGVLLAKLSEVRASGGDPQAFVDYAEWLKMTTPAQLEYSLAESLSPFRRFATNEVLSATADSLFSETNSAWGKLPWKGTGSFNPIESDLVVVPAFQRLLARELDSKSVCGTVQWRNPNTASFSVTNFMNMSGSRALDLSEEGRPANGTNGDLRWCDWVAWSLSNAKRIPPFNPFAPAEVRNEAIRHAKELLVRGD